MIEKSTRWIYRINKERRAFGKWISIIFPLCAETKLFRMCFYS